MKKLSTNPLIQLTIYIKFTSSCWKYTPCGKPPTPLPSTRGIWVFRTTGQRLEFPQCLGWRFFSEFQASYTRLVPTYATKERRKTHPWLIWNTNKNSPLGKENSNYFSWGSWLWEQISSLSSVEVWIDFDPHVLIIRLANLVQATTQSIHLDLNDVHYMTYTPEI